MANGTIIQQGIFTSLGAPVTLSIRSGVDWIETRNLTAINAGTAAIGYEFEWQAGMQNGTAIETQANGAGNAVFIVPVAAPDGFTIVDSSANPLGAAVATTAATNATRPVVSTASTVGLSAGSVVRIYNNGTVGPAGQPALQGMDFSIDTIVANTSFRLANTLANVPGAAGTAGFYRIVNFPSIFYPRARFIVNITQAATAVVTTSVDHGYTVGQEVRFNVPVNSNGTALYGMAQISGLKGTILAVTNSTFTVNIDTTGFTAFQIPTAAQIGAGAFTQPQVVPLGEDSVIAPNVLDDATVNTAFIGVVLAAGADSPAGQNGDVIIWKAGKSFNV